MVSITTKQVLLIIYGVAFVCCIIALATDGGIFYSGAPDYIKAYAAFLLIGCISVAIAFVIELLAVFIQSMKTNNLVGLLSIIFLFLAGISLIIACAVYTRAHLPYGWTVAACTLIMEAILMFFSSTLLLHINWPEEITETNEFINLKFD